MIWRAGGFRLVQVHMKILVHLAIPKLARHQRPLRFTTVCTDPQPYPPPTQPHAVQCRARGPHLLSAFRGMLQLRKRQKLLRVMHQVPDAGAVAAAAAGSALAAPLGYAAEAPPLLRFSGITVLRQS